MKAWRYGVEDTGNISWLGEEVTDMNIMAMRDILAIKIPRIQSGMIQEYLLAIMKSGS